MSAQSPSGSEVYKTQLHAASTYLFELIFNGCVFLIEAPQCDLEFRNAPFLLRYFCLESFNLRGGRKCCFQRFKSSLLHRFVNDSLLALTKIDSLQRHP